MILVFDESEFEWMSNPRMNQEDELEDDYENQSEDGYADESEDEFCDSFRLVGLTY